MQNTTANFALKKLPAKMVPTWIDKLFQDICAVFCICHFTGWRINLELLPNEISAGYLKKEKGKQNIIWSGIYG